MHETSAQGLCTGMTQKDGMGREVGGGSGWGTQVNPWLIHVNVWQKSLQYCKLISLQLIKIKGKKRKKKKMSFICSFSITNLFTFSWIFHEYNEMSVLVEHLLSICSVLFYCFWPSSVKWRGPCTIEIWLIRMLVFDTGKIIEIVLASMSSPYSRDNNT